MYIYTGVALEENIWAPQNQGAKGAKWRVLKMLESSAVGKGW